MCVIEIPLVIETRRLVLRSPSPRDISAIAKLANDEAIARMTCRMPHPFAHGDAVDFIAAAAAQNPAKASTFVIEHEDLGPVGVVGMFQDVDLAPEAGYWIGRPYWGRGFATEALQGALVWAGTRWSRRAMMAGHFTDNPTSGRVLQKAGFLYTGEIRRVFSRARDAHADKRMMVWLA